MKKFGILLTACMVVLLSGLVMSEEMPDSLEKAKMMEYMQLAQPGEEHEFLSKLEGDWDMNLQYWMSPGTDPMILNSSGSFKMILGGRFLEMTSSGQFMGQDMETLHILGFDRRSGDFISTGFDSHGTYSVSAKGKYDKETNKLSMYGEDYDAYWDFTQKYYFDVVFTDDDNFIWSVIFVDEKMAQGQESFKMVEINYTRKK